MNYNKTLADLCEAHDLIEGYEDVRDGADGKQLPNDAMTARMLIAEAILEIRKQQTRDTIKRASDDNDRLRR